MENMDLGIVLDKIRPKAAYRKYDTYENLENTWEDKVQILPTEDEIKTAWEKIQQEQAQPIVVTPEVSQDIADMYQAMFDMSARLEKLEGGV